jgi:hypothetical protein
LDCVLLRLAGALVVLVGRLSELGAHGGLDGAQMLFVDLRVLFPPSAFQQLA